MKMMKLKNKNSIKFVLVLLWSIFFSPCFGQHRIGENEIDLMILLDSVKHGSTDHVKYNANENFITLLTQTLNDKQSLNYSFDSLKIGKFTASDKNMRLFNWMIMKENGGYEYFAVVQLQTAAVQYKVIVLENKWNEISNKENVMLANTDWYGALYSEMIEKKYNKQTYYTFLGWNGANNALNQSIIDVMTIKSNGDIAFGASNYFYFPKEKKRRIVNEFSKKAGMILRYDQQYYTPAHQHYLKGKSSKPIQADMIIFDRLYPEQEHLQNYKEFYIPGGNVYDGFLFKDGKWIFVNDIDAKNKKKPKKSK